MTLVHPRNAIALLGSLSVSAAALTAEISAQSRTTPVRTLSDAIAEARRGPFHGDPPQSGPRAQRLLRPAVAPSFTPFGHTGPQSFASRSPGAGVPTTEDAPRLERLFLWTTLATIASYGTVFLYEEATGADIFERRCNSGARSPMSVCLLADPGDVVVATLTIVTVPAVAAAVAGSRLWRSLVGSIAGFAGVGWAIRRGTEPGIPSAAAFGLWTLTHAGVTMLIAG